MLKLYVTFSHHGGSILNTALSKFRTVLRNVVVLNHCEEGEEEEKVQEGRLVFLLVREQL